MIAGGVTLSSIIGMSLENMEEKKVGGGEILDQYF